MSATSRLTEPSQPVIHQAYKGRYPDSGSETTVLYLGTRRSVPQVKVSQNGEIKFYNAKLEYESNEPVFIIGQEIA